MPTMCFFDQGGDLRQSVLVFKLWQSRAAEDRVELRLGFRPDFRAQNHCEDKARSR
jgi:hypothetical protein